MKFNCVGLLSFQEESILRGGVLPEYVTLSCGQQHSALVTNTGDVYTWGKSSNGRYVCMGGGESLELRRRDGFHFCTWVRLHNGYSTNKRHFSFLCSRLGHGDLIEEEGKSTPFRVELLYIQKYGLDSSLCFLRVKMHADAATRCNRLIRGKLNNTISFGFFF